VLCSRCRCGVCERVEHALEAVGQGAKGGDQERTSLVGRGREEATDAVKGVPNDAAHLARQLVQVGQSRSLPLARVAPVCHVVRPCTQIDKKSLVVRCLAFYAELCVRHPLAHVLSPTFILFAPPRVTYFLCAASPAP
jgi:hypothetical protein